MDFQNAEFYKLNKNTTDLVYNFSDEIITYRKEEGEKGNFHIVEYRRKEGRKGKKITIRREVPSHEMTVADFDTWKARLTEEALHYRRHDDLTTRKNVSIENLLETDLVCDESVENEFIRAENEKQLHPKDETAMLELLNTLTPVQRRRYYKSVGLGISSRDIAIEEGCSHTAILDSIESAKKKLKKECKKRGYLN